MAQLGSPPHTRGKPSLICTTSICIRLTPAHAGKTTPFSQTLQDTQAHPRTRGENFFFLFQLFFVAGSPPHTRGKPLTSPIYGFTNRLTPAHAGKTLFPELRDNFARAHPRTRGENLSLRQPDSMQLGSPPHTRGKHTFSNLSLYR